MRARINGKKNSAWVTAALCLAFAVLGLLHFGGIGTKWLTLLAGIGVIALLSFLATRNLKETPGPLQNIAEIVVARLKNFFSEIALQSVKELLALGAVFY